MALVQKAQGKLIAFVMMLACIATPAWANVASVSPESFWVKKPVAGHVVKQTKPRTNDKGANGNVITPNLVQTPATDVAPKAIPAGPFSGSQSVPWSIVLGLTLLTLLPAL